MKNKRCKAIHDLIIQFPSLIFFFLVDLCNACCKLLVFRVNEKCVAKPTEGEPTSQYNTIPKKKKKKKKNFHEQRAFGAWFLSCGLLTAKYVQSPP
jgi:hypothetical protein